MTELKSCQLSDEVKAKREYYSKWRTANREKCHIARKRYSKMNPWSDTHKRLRQRCENPNNNSFHKYGGKGIKLLLTLQEVKFLWLRDNAFELKRPSIDRIDPDGDYVLSNCRFIELSENSARRRDPV